MVEYLFWITLTVIIYIYLGYPYILAIYSRMFPREIKTSDSYLPDVSLVISAFNEEDVILQKIENSLALDYPEEKYEIWIVSDASSDKTDELVTKFNHPRVKLMRLDERAGKTLGITKVMERIKSEVVVFSDANAIYNKDALKQLVKNFADPGVGYVVGQAKYSKDKQNAAGEQEDTYWSFEIKLKINESKVSSVVGGDGAIYAIRHKLFKPLSASDINDFVNPIQIILQGYRGVFNPQAICYENPADTFMKEYRRKRRIVNRSWRGLWNNAAVLNPFKTGSYAWQMFSHKLLRWLGGFFAIPLFLLNLLLLDQGWLYGLSLAGQMGFYLLALIGYTLDRQNEKANFIISMPYYFVMVNIASLQGIWDAFRGETYTTWTTVRDRGK